MQEYGGTYSPQASPFPYSQVVWISCISLSLFTRRLETSRGNISATAMAARADAVNERGHVACGSTRRPAVGNNALEADSRLNERVDVKDMADEIRESFDWKALACFAPLGGGRLLRRPGETSLHRSYYIQTH